MVFDWFWFLVFLGFVLLFVFKLILCCVIELVDLNFWYIYWLVLRFDLCCLFLWDFKLFLFCFVAKESEVSFWDRLEILLLYEWFFNWYFLFKEKECCKFFLYFWFRLVIFIIFFRVSVKWCFENVVFFKWIVFFNIFFDFFRFCVYLRCELYFFRIKYFFGYNLIVFLKYYILFIFVVFFLFSFIILNKLDLYNILFILYYVLVFIR